MQWIRSRIVIAGLITMLATGLSVGFTSQVVIAQQSSAAQQSGTAFNDEYVFATTRGLNNWDGVHPALKLTLFPVTIVLDTVFLPFAVIAGFVSA